MNTHQGYAKQTLSADWVLLANGGHKKLGNAADDIPVSNSTVNTNLNADLLDGYHQSSFAPILRYPGNSSARWFKVRINVGYGSMFSITVKVNGGYVHKIFEINGYNYSTNKGWHAPTASCIADSQCSSSGLSNTIVFGKDGDGEIWFAVYAAGYSSLEIMNAHFYWSNQPTDLRGAFTVTLVDPANVDGSFNGIGTVVNTSTVAILRAYRASILNTPRTFTIGATGKDFDGSANISWTLANILGSASVGDSDTPIYWNGNSFVACTVAPSSINTGTANRIAYYRGTDTIVSGNSVETDGTFLHILNDTDVSGASADTSAPFTIGTLTGTHLAMDGNEILAKTDATTSGILYLQDTSGVVQVNGTGGLKVWDINIATNATTDAAKRTIGSNSTLYLNSGASSSIIFNIDGSEKARFNQPNGYLGLGVSSPAYRLHVAGEAYVTEKIYVKGGGNILGSTGNNTNIYIETNSKQVVLSDSEDALRRGTASDSQNLSLGTTTYPWKGVYSSIGFIKTGVTNPDTYVLLAGGGHKALSDFVLTTDNYYIATTLASRSQNPGQNITGTGTITSSTTHTYDIGSSSNVYEHVYTRYIDTDSGYDLRLCAAGTERIHITATNGNVGIGTVNPGYKLHVAGNSMFTDTVNIDSNGMGDKAHINFNRAGWNYIKIPTSGTLAMSVNGVGGSNTFLAVNSAATYPGYHDGICTLGTSDYRWANIFSVLGNFTGQITSTVATGYSPFIISSTTLNANLNADLLDGEHEYTIRAYPKNNGDVLFSALPYLESGVSIIKSPVVSMDDAPFGKCFGPINSNSSFYTDYIAVKPGDVLYGEIWAYRAISASGTAGALYYGIDRYDRNKNPISSNSGCVYFVASNVTVPADGTWHKYSGTTTIPTSHTVYSNSDGNGVYYVRVRVLVNYSSGTIPTYIGGIQLAKTFVSSDNKIYINGQTLSVTNPVKNITTTEQTIATVGGNDIKAKITVSNSNPIIGTEASTIATIGGTTISARVDHTRTTIISGTIGSDTDTSGDTVLAIPYIVVNEYGHITDYGTRTHTVTGTTGVVTNTHYHCIGRTHTTTDDSENPGQGITGIGSITPETTLSYTLGSNSKYWSTTYSRSIYSNATTTTGGYYVYGNGASYGHLYITAFGTASDGTNQGTQGKTTLVLGNSTARASASSTAGANNAMGVLRLFSSGTKYHDIMSRSSLASNRTLYLPDYGGWIAVGGTETNGIISGVGSTSTPVYLSDAGELKACSNLDAKTLDGTLKGDLFTSFTGGGLSSSGNYLTQASHTITIGGTSKSAGQSNNVKIINSHVVNGGTLTSSGNTMSLSSLSDSVNEVSDSTIASHADIITSLSISELLSTHATNLKAAITINGVTSDEATITNLYSTALVARDSLPITDDGTLVHYKSQNASVATSSTSKGSSGLGSYSNIYYPQNGTYAPNTQLLRLRWNSSYWKEFFLSPNNSQIFYRSVGSNTSSDWYVIPKMIYACSTDTLDTQTTLGSTSQPIYIDKGIFKTCTSVGGSQVQSDWSVTDTTSMAYIKNKPTIPTIPTHYYLNFYNGSTSCMTYNSSATRYFKTDGETLYSSGAGTSTSAAYTIRTYTPTVTSLDSALASSDNSYGVWYTDNKTPFSENMGFILGMRKTSGNYVQVSFEDYSQYGIWYRYSRGSAGSWKKIMVNNRYTFTNVYDLGELCPLTGLVYNSSNVLFGIPASAITITNATVNVGDDAKQALFMNGTNIEMHSTAANDLIILVNDSGGSGNNSPFYAEIYGFGIEVATKGFNMTLQIDIITGNNTTKTLYTGNVSGNSGYNFIGVEPFRIGGNSGQQGLPDRYYKLKFTFHRTGSSSTNQPGQPLVKNIRAYTINKWIQADSAQNWALNAKGGYSQILTPTPATTSAYGVVKVAGTSSSAINTTQASDGTYYGVQIDSNGKLFVRVPTSSSGGLTIGSESLSSSNRKIVFYSGSGSTIKYSTSEFYVNNTGVYFLSDRNLKTNIQQYIVEKDMNENPIKKFNWKKEPTATSIGFIAQEIQEWCPEAVGQSEEGNKTVNYNIALSALCGYMFDRIKKLEKLVKQLEEQLNINKC